MSDNKYKIGDKVKIVKSDEDEFKSYVGEEVYIENIPFPNDEYKYSLSSTTGYWSDHELMLVESDDKPSFVDRQYEPSGVAFNQELQDGCKYDKGKARWSLIPLDVIQGAADVFTFGANKYSDYGWQQGVLERPDKYISALMRHITEYQSGQRIDEDSGMPTMDHILCNCIILGWYDKHKTVDYFKEVHQENELV